MKKLDEYNKLPITGDAIPPEPRKDIQIKQAKELLARLKRLEEFVEANPGKHGHGKD